MEGMKLTPFYALSILLAYPLRCSPLVTFFFLLVFFRASDDAVTHTPISHCKLAIFRYLQGCLITATALSVACKEKVSVHRENGEGLSSEAGIC